MISTFEDGRASVSDEMRRLGDGFCLDVVTFCQKLVLEPRRIATLKTLATIGSIKLFHATIGTDFVIMAIDAVAAGETDVVILFAGRHGHPSVGWDGADYGALVADVIVPRCTAMFTA